MNNRGNLHFVDKRLLEQDERCEQHATELVGGVSDKGWGIVRFTDFYEKKCAIQDSTIATEACIWLGVSNIEPKILVPGEGWKPYSIPEEVLLSGRMHLTQTMVKQLLPFLTRFAETGAYLADMDEFSQLTRNPV